MEEAVSKGSGVSRGFISWWVELFGFMRCDLLFCWAGDGLIDCSDESCRLRVVQIDRLVVFTKSVCREDTEESCWRKEAGSDAITELTRPERLAFPLLTLNLRFI